MPWIVLWQAKLSVTSMDVLIHNEMRSFLVSLFWRCICPAPNALMIWTEQSCLVVEASVVISWKLSLNIVHSGLRVIIIIKQTQMCGGACSFRATGKKGIGPGRWNVISIFCFYLPSSLVSVTPLTRMSVADNVQKYVLPVRMEKYQSVCIPSKH